MEAEPSRRRLRAPNPLSDCTNTISSTTTTATTLATAASSQSSSASTVKLKRQNPKLPSVTGNLLSAVDPNPSVVPPPIPSTPPRPRPVSSSASGTSDREALEPCSVYTRRQTAVKGEGKGKENTGSWSCPPAPKTRNAGKKTKASRCNSVSMESMAPHNKKQHAVPAGKEHSEKQRAFFYEIEQKRKYFAEIDAFELSEEEVDSVD
ncbi:endochitinase A [Pyrus ussuriensis x Pyrus communis]|uniref:Endochitinase A n=1 Tax=Pyrus ussuriensis x Pyrus communis TaxID=2448454 RepID=A0A5N5F076_9ROSA|nr:endochitinase A [Pyrus ussuriensis x Pyrus communis]